MELRQLRSLVTLVESDFNVSRTASKLHLVQPAISQHLKQLEEELGLQLFQRHGKRLVGLSEAGEQVLRNSINILNEMESIFALSHDHLNESCGTLRLGATHTQARYVLPPVIRHFSRAYPRVEVQIHQGTPQQLVEMVLKNRVDLAICTEALSEQSALTALASYRWNRCLIAPQGHPILNEAEITLESLCRYPLITYVFGFTGRGNLNETFAKQDLQPQIALSAADTDVIKTYVREGLGVGVIATLAYNPQEDADLQQRDLGHLFPWETTKIAHLKSRYLRKFQQEFINLFRRETARLGGCRS